MSKRPRNKTLTALHAAKESWKAMKRRCDDPNYHATHRYKGRGINYPEYWKEFDNFLLDMGLPGEDLDVGRFKTLERKDNDLSYSKENCIWATRYEQSRNLSSRLLLRLGFMD